jgi:hypothetical protein
VRDYTGVGTRTSWRTLVATLVATALVTLATPAAPQLGGLARLRHVDVAVHLDHALDVLTAEDLLARLQDGLGRGEPPLAVSDGATDRIRLVVAVQPTSATALRGFWLPFSGTYGVGAVRLAVERLVTIPGLARPVPAVVWQTERIVGAPWRATEREIVRLLDEMVAELLTARREAG